MTPNEERMAVNAAIEKLIAHDDADGEAARVVIRYGSKLKQSGNIQIERIKNKKSSDGEVSGYSPQHGEITVKDEEREERVEWASGIYKDRIGHYRLWKGSEKRLQFQHFWKSSLTTQPIDGKGPDIYFLGFDPASLEPTYLGVLREKITLTFWLIYTVEIIHPYLEAIYGTVPELGGFGVRLSRRTKL